MDGISDSQLVSALRRQMTIAVAKQVASAGNLANVDTPDYKAVEVNFESALDAYLRDLVATPPADPEEPVIYAGWKEHHAREERRAQGIPLHPKVVDYLRGLCAELGVECAL